MDKLIPSVKVEKDDIKIIGKILKKIDTLPSIDKKKIIKICKLIKKIDKLNKDNYKYGSSWLDELFMKRSIKSINNILEEYNIIIF